MGRVWRGEMTEGKEMVWKGRIHSDISIHSTFIISVYYYYNAVFNFNYIMIICRKIYSINLITRQVNYCTIE